jgi:hypothetical protein
MIKIDSTIPSVGIDIQVNRVPSIKRFSDGVFTDFARAVILHASRRRTGDTAGVLLNHVQTVLGDVYDGIVSNIEICCREQRRSSWFFWWRYVVRVVVVVVAHSSRCLREPTRRTALVRLAPMGVFGSLHQRQREVNICNVRFCGIADAIWETHQENRAC